MTEMKNQQSDPKQTSNAALQKSDLIDFIHSIIQPLGYFVVDLEIQRGRSAKLQLFVDRLPTSDTAVSQQGITIDDCVEVSRSINEPLDESSLVSEIFKSSYELEVSSPGINRPLRTLQDFQEYQGKRARVSLYRAMDVEEIENQDFQQRNPKQKLFVGLLAGADQDAQKILLDIERKKSQWEKVKIPLNLIAKANLDPEIDFEKGNLS